MSADLNVDITSSYSLAEARSLAEKLSENLPASSSETSLSEMSGNSASGQVEAEDRPVDLEVSEEDELEEGEIREEKPSQLTASSSRNLTLSNEDNTSLHLSVYDEDGERKLYLHADTPFTLPLAVFRRYLAEVADEEDEVARMEQQRQAEFDNIATTSMLGGALLALVFCLWLSYILTGVRIIS